jgi:uncharacterized membrane protein YcgQ (UPF0703/DUF1980 family)
VAAPIGHVDRTKPITLSEIVAGNVDEDTRNEVGARDGRAARLSGIVTKVAHGRIDVTRFQIWCCAADAIPYTVYEVMASDVHRAPKPADPYL